MSTRVEEWGVMCGDFLRYGPYSGEDAESAARTNAEDERGATLNGHPYEVVRREITVTDWTRA